MLEINRKNARIAVYEMLFETEFRTDDAPEAIYATASDVRDIPEDEYIKKVYFGVIEHKEEIDAMIEKFSDGWKVSRVSKPSLCAMRISIFEMKYVREIPFTVSINEAIEITKSYDEEKAKAFVNGVLNGIKNDIEAENDDATNKEKNAIVRKNVKAANKNKSNNDGKDNPN